MAYMTRVLILSIVYYPVEVPATFRVASFARWLPEYGYSVRVLAPEWNRENTRSLEHWAVALIDKVPAARMAETVSFPASPSMLRDWAGKYPFLSMPGNRVLIKKMVAAGKQLHQHESFDVILTSAPTDITMLMAADQLSCELGIPWIADKRDIAGQWPGKGGAGLLGMAAFWAQRLTRVPKRLIAAETELCNRAFVTTTVSDSLANVLRSRGVNRVEVIYNGYEEEDFTVYPLHEAKFTVQYFGSINLYAEINPLLDALDDLLRRRKIEPNNFEVYFWGSTAAHFIAPLVVQRFCRKVVAAKGHIPKREAVARMKGSQVLLHLSFGGVKGIITSKIMEYMAAGAPILSVPGDGDVVDRFLKETGAGVSLGEPGAIAEYLLEHYQAWKRGEAPQNAVDPAAKEFYTRRKQAEKMARLLDEAIAGHEGVKSVKNQVVGGFK